MGNSFGEMVYIDHLSIVRRQYAPSAKPLRLRASNAFLGSPSSILRHFYFYSFGGPLTSQLRSLRQKCDLDRRAQNSHNNRLCFFYPSDISHFHSFGCSLGSPFASLQQKCDPDKRAQNSHKSRLCFLPIRHFPFPLIWLSLEVPISIFVATV